jgi:hypothetical protein
MNIIDFSEYFCIKDCYVMMLFMNKFNQDLKKVYDENLQVLVVSKDKNANKEKAATKFYGIINYVLI